jgi:hypothetical protein
LSTNDDTIFHAEGTLPDGRAYRAELWQLGPAYHMTIFISRPDGETAGELAATVEEALIQFCGTHYRRVEPIFRDGQPFWSYNVVVSDDEEQFVSRLPLMRGVASFSVQYGERAVVFSPPPSSLKDTEAGPERSHPRRGMCGGH